MKILFMGTMKSIPWILTGALFGVLLSIPALNSSLFDDAYIHARIAENVMAYGKPIFNVGDTFKAGSSTGFVLLVAALSRFFGVIGSIRVLEVGAIFFTVTGLFCLVGLSRGGRIRGFFYSLCAIPYVLLAAYGGMESPIMCALLVGAALSFHHQKHWLVVFLISLAAWMRFEVMLLLGLVCFSYFYKNSKGRFQFFSLSPLFALIITETVFFNGMIPHAARVKSVAYGMSFLQSIFNAASFGLGKFGLLFGGLLSAVFFFRAIRVIGRKFEFEFSDVLFGFSAGIFFAWAIGRSLIFPWYYCLLVFPFCVAAIVDSQAPAGGQGFVRQLVPRGELVTAAILGVLGLKAVLVPFGVLSGAQPNLRVPRYLEIGSALYSFCPACNLVTSEIGGLGYSFKGRVYDAFGLGDPDAVKYHPMKIPEEREWYGIGAIPPKYVVFRDPEFIVSMPVFSAALRSSKVLEKYIGYDCPLEESGNLVIFGDKKIQVFSKSELPASTLLSMGCEKI